MMVAFGAINFSAQAQDTTHTLIQLIKPQTIGLYVAPEFSYGQLRGDMTTFGGMSGMFVVNKKWAIGATAQMSTNDAFVPKAVSPLAVKAGWGGAKIEYTPKPNALVHVSFPLVIGGGEASADSVSTRSDNGNGHDKDVYGTTESAKNQNSNGFVVVQPGIHFEANLLRYAKIYVGADYRLSFLTSNQTTLLPANTLQGFSISAGLKMGLFDFKLNRKKALPTTN